MLSVAKESVAIFDHTHTEYVSHLVWNMHVHNSRLVSLLDHTPWNEYSISTINEIHYTIIGPG